MITVVIVVHILIAAALIFLILLQKNEGNAAGGGFSVSSATAMMQPRARPNPLSRAPTVLGICFFASSLSLAFLARQNGPAPSILDEPGKAASSHAPKVDEIQVPAGETPPASAPAPSSGAPPAETPAPPTVPKS